jgi:hypothetical protein
MADDDSIQRKHDRLAVEMHDYFWNVCPELTARWKQAMLTLPPPVLQELAVEDLPADRRPGPNAVPRVWGRALLERPEACVRQGQGQ